MTSTAYDDQFTEHPTDEDYRNRAERAEQECAELRAILAECVAVADTQIKRIIACSDRHDAVFNKALQVLREQP